MPLPFQGATIFSGGESHGATVIDSPLSPQTVAQRINTATPVDADGWREHVTTPVPLTPFVPPPPYTAPVPVFWTIYNRWTGKYVVDMTGNEHADDANAVQFPSQLAAVQFARSLVGKSITHALAQSPPENDGHCYKCGTANARGTVTCTHCQKPIDVATSWVQVHAHDAQGRWGGPTVYA